MARGFAGQRSGGQRAYLIVLGVVSIVGSLIVAIFPGRSLVLLTQIAGGALLLIGAVTCLSAIWVDAAPPDPPEHFVHTGSADRSWSGPVHRP